MMETEDYRHLAAELRRYAKRCGERPREGEGETEEDLGRQAADAIEELIEKVESLENRIRVGDSGPEFITAETPLGTLIARLSNGEPDYPGIRIDIRMPDTNQDLELALTEFTATEGDLPETGHIISRVYGDALADEYTERVVHEKIEDYFRIEREKEAL